MDQLSISTLSTLIGLVAVAGGGFYFIGRLSSRIDSLEQRLARHDAMVDRIYDKIDGWNTLQEERISTLKSEIMRAISIKGGQQ